MKYEFDLASIIGVQNGALLYNNGGKLDIKESADVWWDNINTSINQLGYYLFDEG